MASGLIAGGRAFPCRAVLFDKDGTLLDFHRMWGPITRRQVEGILHRATPVLTASQAGGDRHGSVGPRWGRPVQDGPHPTPLPAQRAPREGIRVPHRDYAALKAELFAALGYSPESERADPRGPLAIGTQAQSLVAAATVLYLRGMPWDLAIGCCDAAFGEVAADYPPDRNVIACADLPRLFGALRAAGLAFAVVTTDIEAATRRQLALLGIAELVDAVACADQVERSKPAPDLALLACARLGVSPDEAVIVGDTVADLLMGRSAEMGGCVGVLTGVSSAEILADYADAIVDCVGAIAAPV